jgi:mercuric ion transport protein
MKGTQADALAVAGTVLAALGASLCCILPVAVAVLGVGSAALGAQLEPLRPYFLVLTLGILGFAFYRAYRPEPCEPGQACAVPASRRRHRLLLWIVAAVALALITFPYYAGALL